MCGVPGASVEALLQDLAELGLHADSVGLEDLSLRLVPEAAESDAAAVVDLDDEVLPPPSPGLAALRRWRAGAGDVDLTGPHLNAGALVLGRGSDGGGGGSDGGGARARRVGVVVAQTGGGGECGCEDGIL